CAAERWESKSGYNPPDSWTRTGEYGRRRFTVRLDQNVALMLNSPVQNPDYIPGSAFQGAFAKVFKGKDYFNTLFFEDLKFGNAYVSDGKAVYTPTPLSWVKIKNEDGKAYDLADGACRKSGKQYVSVGGNSFLEGNTLSTLSVRRGTDYHINKGKSNKLKAQMFFNVDRLDKGQVFSGYIYGSESALDMIAGASEEDIRIGASIGAEYGKCRIKMFPFEKAQDLNFKSGDRIVIELISDCIIVDKYGTNTLSTDALLDAVCGEGKYEKCKDSDGNLLVFAKTLVTGGYNRKWGCPKPQYQAFAKGSVFVVKCTDYVVTPPFIGIGNGEGYGNITVKVHMAKDELDTYSAKKAEAAGTDIEAPHECSAAEKIIAVIDKNKAVKEIEEFALTAAQDLHSDNLSDSAAMRLLNLYQSMKIAGKIEPDEFEKRISTFDKNDELFRMAKNVLKLFREHNCPSDLFEVYMKAFIVRTKEIRRQTKRDPGNQGEGVESNG
ncbi:MAG: hypothetical protein K5647_05165, partial [Clostridiales bacterium]|nr:hypothetical protein [Clostridiales bacterium]